MKKPVVCILALVLLLSFCKAQEVDEVYKQPLKESLNQVEKNYHVQLNYDDEIVNNRFVHYATWRFTSDVKIAMDNILKPFDLIYTQTAKNAYRVSRYEFYRRSEEEGKNISMNY